MASSKRGLKRSRQDAQDGNSTTNDRSETSQPASKKARVGASRSLFVRSLPPTATNDSLAELFSQHFPVKHATVVLDPISKASRGFGFVTLTDAEDAVEAKNKLDKELWDGRRIRVEIAESRHREAGDEAVQAASERQKRVKALEEARRAPKLIIRNLPWSIKSSSQLSALFQSFGKVKFADLPNTHGKLKGFGFVTIRGRQNAEKAMEALNGQLIDGRTLAVDWAVEKNIWDKQQDAESASKTVESNVEVEVASEEEEEEEEASEHKIDEGVDADEDAGDIDDLGADLENFMKNHMQNLEDDSAEDGSDKNDDSEDEFEDANSIDASTVGAGKSAKSTDNSSTVFVRNLPFTATDDILKAHFAQFGPVRYARVVMDRANDRPAGTGFVCFVKDSDFKACVKEAPRAQASLLATKHSVLQDESADQGGRYTLEGRVLQVAQAVSKDEATRLTTDGSVKRRETDKRRLFLLSEGQIDQRSPLYRKLAQSEIQMRDQSASQRKKLVQKNPSLHLSLTRLAIRNIPRNITSKQLKELAREACVEFAKDVKEGKRQPLSKEETARSGKEAKEAEHQRKLKKKGIVSQAKVVFESREGSKVPEATGSGKSRGYGFIEYSSHRWALMGLRWLNGHQLENEEGKKQRLIVEFSIENAQVIARRKATTSQQSRNQKQAAEEKSNPQPQSKSSASKFSKNSRGTRPLKKDSAAESSLPKSRKPDGEGHDLKQTLIARKRMVRKKKSVSRGKA